MSRYLIIGLCLAVIAAGGFLAWQQRPSPDHVEVPTETEPEAASVPTEIVIEPNIEPEPTVEAPPQYSIPWLQSQPAAEVALTVERVVSDGGDFRAEVVSYPSEGLKLNALQLTPKSVKPAAGYPVVIVNHGYIPPDEYSTVNNYRSISDFYARQGYLVLKPDYRAHADSEGDRAALFNRAAYALDVLNLIHGVDNLAEADRDRIYLYGHSMGGDVNLRVLAATDRVKGATLWAPVSEDFPESFLYFVRRGRGQELPAIEAKLTQTLTPEQYALFSPRQYLAQITTPVLIHHGTEDESVPYSWSTALVEAMETAGTPHTFYTYPGEDHNFRRGSWQTVANRDLAFFGENR